MVGFLSVSSTCRIPAAAPGEGGRPVHGNPKVVLVFCKDGHPISRIETRPGKAATSRAVLTAKNSDLGPLVRQAARDDELLEHLSAGLTEKNETWRYNCFKAVYRLAQENPARVYPYWDRVAASLASDNGYHRAGAALLLPLLLPAIVRGLLGAETSHHTPSRKELLKSDVIEALERLFPALRPASRKKALAFVMAQVASPSPRTRKALRRFHSTLDRARRETPY